MTAIEQAGAEAHIGFMRFFLRRFMAALVAVVFAAGLQIAAVSGATASAGPTITKVASLAQPESCKACGQQTSAAGECVAVCGSGPVLAAQMVSAPSFSASNTRTWLNEVLPTGGIQPDPSPPRL